MAKGNSKGGSADGTLPSLTALLAPNPVNLMLAQSLAPYEENADFFDPNRVIKGTPLSDIYNREYSDRRRYDPTKRSRSPHATIRSATELHIGSVGTPYGRLSASVRFREPRQVDLCVRRHTRRSVLFALNRTAKGSGQKTRRRNFFSDVKC